jgi:tRNA-2-methylthio-N6-dimethylallyladenosine synthase
MFSFKYSPRPKTLAGLRMADDVGEAEKTRRIVTLQALQKQIQGEILSALIGQTHAVLVDGASRRREHELAGRTSGNTIVNFAGDPSLLGHLVSVRVTEAGPNSVRGVLTGDQPCPSN